MPARSTAATVDTSATGHATAATSHAHPLTAAAATVTPPKQTYHLRSGPSLRHEMEAEDLDNAHSQRQVLALALCRVP